MWRIVCGGKSAAPLARAVTAVKTERRGGWEAHLERELRGVSDIDVGDDGKGETGLQNFKLG